MKTLHRRDTNAGVAAVVDFPGIPKNDDSAADVVRAVLRGPRYRMPRRRRPSDRAREAETVMVFPIGWVVVTARSPELQDLVGW
jgi:hypothetical protein